jgi:hypothetical protein
MNDIARKMELVGVGWFGRENCGVGWLVSEAEFKSGFQWQGLSLLAELRGCLLELSSLQIRSAGLTGLTGSVTPWPKLEEKIDFLKSTIFHET